jgi:hypothetical protein
MSRCSAGLGDLVRYRQELKAREKEIQQELRRRKKNDATRSKRADAARQLHEDVAVHVLASSSDDLAWMRSYCEQRGISSKEVVAFQEVVVKKFKDMGEGAMADLVESTTHRGHLCSHQARAFLRDWDLHRWIEHCNRYQGLTVAVADLMHRRDLLMPQAENCGADSPRRGSSKSAGYKWVKRFRCRWRLRHLRSSAREAVPLEQMREKVPGNVSINGGPSRFWRMGVFFGTAQNLVF